MGPMGLRWALAGTAKTTGNRFLSEIFRKTSTEVHFEIFDWNFWISLTMSPLLTRYTMPPLYSFSFANLHLANQKR